MNPRERGACRIFRRRAGAHGDRVLGKPQPIDPLPYGGQRRSGGQHAAAGHAEAVACQARQVVTLAAADF